MLLVGEYISNNAPVMSVVRREPGLLGFSCKVDSSIFASYDRTPKPYNVVVSFQVWCDRVRALGVDLVHVDPAWLLNQYQVGLSPVQVARVIGVPPKQSKANKVGCIVSMVLGLAFLGFIIVQSITKQLHKDEFDQARRMAKIRKGLPPAPAKKSEASTAVPEQNEEILVRDYLKSIGLDPKLSYPFFPLVYDPKWEMLDNACVGRIKNYSGMRIRGVRVTFDLFDRQGNKVGEAWDMIPSIGPWETWRYKAVFFESDASSARFTGITSL